MKMVDLVRMTGGDAFVFGVYEEEFMEAMWLLVTPTATTGLMGRQLSG
jgi:hypothetical protein